MRLLDLGDPFASIPDPTPEQYAAALAYLTRWAPELVECVMGDRS